MRRQLFPYVVQTPVPALLTVDSFPWSPLSLYYSVNSVLLQWRGEMGRFYFPFLCECVSVWTYLTTNGQEKTASHALYFVCVPVPEAPHVIRFRPIMSIFAANVTSPSFSVCFLYPVFLI